MNSGARARPRARRSGTRGATIRRLTTAALVTAACAPLVPAPKHAPLPVSTFHSILGEAESGDPSAANLVGYVLTTGRLAPSEYDAARVWFEAAAESGHLVARLNLAVIHFLGAGTRRDPVRAQEHFSSARQRPFPAELRGVRTLTELIGQSCFPSPPRSRVGSEVFLTFCSGCHGEDGLAAFGAAPSFALGERMDKPLDQLLSTVVNGHGSMPKWDDKLPTSWLREALKHARDLEGEFRGGLVRAPGQASNRRFRFGPMSGEPWGEPGPEAVGGPGESDSFEALCARL